MTRKEKSMPQRFVDAMTSMRLTIIVLIVLACTSIVAILFQNYHPTNFPNWEEFYREKLGPTRYGIYSFFQLFTPYHSWWFISLLGVLCVSLFLCSINRLRSAMKFVVSKSDFRDGSRLSRQKNFHSFKTEMGAAAGAFTHILRRKLFTVYVRKDGEKSYIYAKKNAFSRVGPFLSHVGLLALFLGGLVASIWGKSILLWGAPGDYINAPFADHRIYVDDFTIQYTEDGQVKDYLSQLKVIDEEGKVLKQQLVEVNGPLRFRGVSYYQSSYRLHPRKIKGLVIAVSDSNGSLIDTLEIAYGSRAGIGETGYQAEIADFAADFQITEHGVVSKSGELRNPAVLIHYLNGGEVVGHQWLFARFPSVHMSKDQPFRATLLDFEPIYYTGLQAASNPGSAFIWAGFVIMTLGLVLVFYLNHQQVWVAIETAPSGDSVYVAGTSHKFKDRFRTEIKDIVRRAKNEIRSASTEKKQTASRIAAAS